MQQKSLIFESQTKSLRNNKKLLLGLVVLGVLMCAGTASAYSYYGSTSCGYMPPVVKASSYSPIRVGGFFGASSNNLIGLNPGAYTGVGCAQRAGMYYNPYAGARIGGWFGYTPYNNYYYGLRPGMTNFNYGYNGYGYPSASYTLQRAW